MTAPDPIAEFHASSITVTTARARAAAGTLTPARLAVVERCHREIVAAYRAATEQKGDAQ